MQAKQKEKSSVFIFVDNPKVGRQQFYLFLSGGFAHLRTCVKAVYQYIVCTLAARCHCFKAQRTCGALD